MYQVAVSGCIEIGIQKIEFVVKAVFSCFSHTCAQIKTTGATRSQSQTR